MPDADGPPPDAGPTAPALLALDGNALGHRAYHSTRGDDEPDREGIVTAAVVAMVATAWVHGPYDVVVVALDDGVNLRRGLEPSYKAHRPPAPPDLPVHLGHLRAHLDAAGWPVVVAPGAEADDVLVTIADGASERGWRCDVVSSDRDLTMAVGPGVRLLRPRQRFADLAVEDEASVVASYGVPPLRYPDLAALRGDASDGLVGAHGIGERTAARLVRDHGSLRGVLDAIPDLPPRIAASLREARERVERNLLLMSPLGNLGLDLDGIAAHRLDVGRTATMLEGLGFGAAARRLRRATLAGTTSTDAAPRAPHPADA